MWNKIHFKIISKKIFVQIRIFIKVNEAFYLSFNFLWINKIITRADCLFNLRKSVCFPTYTKMKIRHQVLVLADATMVRSKVFGQCSFNKFIPLFVQFFILLSTGVIFAIHPHGIFAHWELIPYIVYPCLGFVASLATILLYIGVYKVKTNEKCAQFVSNSLSKFSKQLSTAYITAWGFFMLFMWQVVLILIIVTKVFDKIHGTKDKMKEMEKYWGKTLMILELWLCKCPNSYTHTHTLSHGVFVCFFRRLDNFNVSHI